MHLYFYENSKDWGKNLNDFDYSLFISPEWIEALETPDRKPVYIDIIDKNKTVAKISGLIIDPENNKKKHLFFYSGPAFQNPDFKIIKACILKLIEYAKENRLNRVIIRSYDYNNIFKENMKNFYITRRSEFKINFTGDKNDIIKSLFHSAIKSVKKAENVFHAQHHHTNSEKYLDKLIVLMEQTKKIRLEKGYKDYSFYYIPYLDKNVLVKLLKNKIGNIFYTTTNSDHINCIQYVLIKDLKAYAILIGTNFEGYKERLPSFIHYYDSIYLQNSGVKYLNIGGDPSDASSEKLLYFKKSIGGIPFCMTGGSTNFLNYPKKILNPLLNIGRKLPKNKIVNYIKEKII